MKPEIILHVGTEKTGSTSVQHLMMANYDILLKSKILFPKSIGQPCHINFTACALEKEPLHPIRQLLGLQNQSDFFDFVRETKQALKMEIERTSPNVLVISDEHINVHLSKKESLNRFKDLCEEFGEIKSVIIYFRQQDEFRLSLFSEAVKSGNLSNFDLDDLLPVFDLIPYRLNYLNILNNLSDIFGEKLVSPRIYDRRLFPQGDVGLDFLNIADIKIESSSEDIKLVKLEINASIDGAIIKHLAQISSVLAKSKNSFSERLRVSIINNCIKAFSGASLVLNREEHGHYLEQFKMNDKAIKDKYFDLDQAGKSLFPNKFLEKNLKNSVYPGCTISWLEFFIKYVSYLNKIDLNNCDECEQPNQKNTIGNNTIEASCTVCGHVYELDVECNAREGKLCPACGASGRAQAISYHVSNFICKKIVPLNDHKVDKSKRIVGLSDGVVYANILKDKYDYTNTFFHREPFLDITSPSEEFYNSCDLLITTEVFEHIIGPSLDAFHGSYAILKPGGYMILTVPFVNNGESVEHYKKGLVDYAAYQNKEGSWEAKLKYNDGSEEIDPNPKFHGGPGKTLEIRLFNRSRLIQELNLSGFIDIVIHDENMPHYGINWSAASRVITARKPLG